MKKFMIRLLLPMIASFLFTATHAQEKQMMSAADRAAKATNWMKTNLGLTDDQVAKVQDINLRYANKSEEVWNGAESKKQKMTTLKGNESSKEEELKNVLNGNQFQTYTQKKEELRREMKGKMKEKKQGV